MIFHNPNRERRGDGEDYYGLPDQENSSPLEKKDDGFIKAGEQYNIPKVAPFMTETLADLDNQLNNLKSVVEKKKNLCLRMLREGNSVEVDDLNKYIAEMEEEIKRRESKIREYKSLLNEMVPNNKGQQIGG